MAVLPGNLFVLLFPQPVLKKPEPVFGHVHPLHHVPDEPLHIEHRREEEALPESSVPEGDQSEIGAEAGGEQGDAAAGILHCLKHRLQVADTE